MPERSEESKAKQRRTIADRVRLLKPFKDEMDADVKSAKKSAALPFKSRRDVLNAEVSAAKDKAVKAVRAEWAPKIRDARAKIGLQLDPDKAWNMLLKQEKEASKPQIEARARKKLEALKLKANGGPVEPDEDEEEEEVPEEEDESESVRAAE